HRGSGAGVRMDHVVQVGYLAVVVSQDRKIHLCALGLVDVVDPAGMRVDGVDRYGQYLDVALGELIRQFGSESQFCRAYRREVGRMREEHTPAVTQVFVKTDRPSGRILFKIGGGVAQTKRSHFGSPVTVGGTTASRI